MKRLSALLGTSLVLICLSACFAPDLADEPPLRFRCTADEDCADGQACSLDDECVNLADFVSPSIAAFVVGGGPLGIGEDVQAEMTVTGDAALPPTLVTQGQGGPRPWTLVDQNDETFTFSYVAAGDEGDGERPVLATLINGVGDALEDLAAGAVSFDFTAPALSLDAALPVRVPAGEQIVRSVIADEPLREPPTVSAISSDGTRTEWNFDNANEEATRFLFDVDTDDLPEGGLLVSATGVDLRGNAVETVIGNLEVDKTAPALVGAEVALIADLANPLPIVTALRPGGSATALLIPTEELSAIEPQPLLCLFNVEATVSVQSLTPARLQVDITNAEAGEGTCTLSATLVDIAGNRGEVVVAEIDVDHLPPALNTSNLVHARAPVGVEQTEALELNIIQPVEVETLDPNASIDATVSTDFDQLVSLRVLDDGVEVAAFGKSSDGNFPPLRFGRDAAAASLVAIDRAGNLSGATEVSQVRWMASLGGRTPGAFAHPAKLELMNQFPSAPGDLSGEIGSAESHSRIDGVSVSSTPTIRLLRAAGGERQQTATGVSATYDVMTNRTVVASGFNTFVQENRNWVRLAPPVDRVRVVTYDPVAGLARILSRDGEAFQLENDAWTPTPEFDVDIPIGARQPFVFATSPYRGVFLQHALGADPNSILIWEPDTGWRSSVPEFVDGVNARRNTTAMGFDPIRNEVVVFGGSVPGFTSCAGEIVNGSCFLNDTWALRQDVWVQVDTGTGPSPRSDSEMVWDAEREELLLIGGRRSLSVTAETWAWNGTSWRLLDADQNGPAVGAAVFDSAEGQAHFFFNVSEFVFRRQGWQPELRRESINSLRPFFLVADPVGGFTISVGLTFEPVARNATSVLQSGFTEVENFPGTLFEEDFSDVAVDMAFDDVEEAILVVDGSTASTWRFNETDWEEVHTRSFCVGRPQECDAPSAPFFPRIAFSDTAGTMMLYAGDKGTWSWEGDSWKHVTDTGPASRGISAGLRRDASGDLLLFDGNPVSTFRLDGTEWVAAASGPDATAETDIELVRGVESWVFPNEGSAVEIFDGTEWVLRRVDRVPAAGGLPRLGWDGAYDGLIGIDGAGDFWRAQDLDRHRPAQVFSARFADAEGPDPVLCREAECAIDRVVVRFLTSTPNAELSVFDGYGWRDLPVVRTQDEVMAIIEDHNLLSRIFVGPEKTVRFALSAPAISTLQRAVTSDYVDVQLDYTRQ